MKTKRLMLFAYDFPHKKTQDFIIRLYSEGYKLDYVIAAPWKRLPIPKSPIRIAPKNQGLIHPRLLCQALKINYLKFAHNSRKTIKYLKNHPVDLYIISGARILTKEIIDAAKNRVLNIHPGLLPEARGLDTILWSIYQNIPIGLSAHFITSRIDSGFLIMREKLLLHQDDTILDVSLRLLESQSDFLVKTLKRLSGIEINRMKNLNMRKNPYHSKMPQILEKKTIKLFNRWLDNHRNSKII